MINPESKAKELLTKYTASDALIQAQQCMYLSPPHRRNYYSVVVDIIKFNSDG